MKISFMTFACPDWRLPRIIEAAVEHGYHGVELRIDARHGHHVEVWTNAEERREIRQQFEDSETEPCCLATSLQLTHDQMLEQVVPRAQLAADIGCPALRVFCGPNSEGWTTRQLIEHAGDRLREAAILIEPLGVRLWLETHDSASRAADAAAMVRHADHPSVGINYDNMHPYRKGEPLDATIAALGDLVRHTHLHDAINDAGQVVIRPLDQGELPMDDMFQALVNMGYTGYLSGEWFHQMYGEDPDTALAQYHRDMTALAARHQVDLPRR